MRVADGAGRDDGTGRIGATRPKFVDGDTWGTAVGAGRGARSGWVELGWRMGRSGTTRPHFGGGSTFIRRDRYVWLGRSEAYSAR